MLFLVVNFHLYCQYVYVEWILAFCFLFPRQLKLYLKQNKSSKLYFEMKQTKMYVIFLLCVKDDKMQQYKFTVYYTVRSP